MSWHGPIRGGRFSPMIWTGTLAGNAGRSVRKDRLAGSRSNCCNAMQSDEQIENDHKCPNTGTLLQDAVTGAVFMGVASFWSVGASWLSAHLVISVDAELMSYWFAIPTVLLGAALYTRSGSQSNNRLWRRASGIIAFCAVLFVLVAWHLCDRTFLFWKARAMSPAQWAQMADDLENVGRQQAASEGLVEFDALPPDLRRLGMAREHCGVVSSINYSGLIADVRFGHRGRTWGFFVGPEDQMKTLGLSGLRCRRVVQNGFVFAGPMD